MSLQSNILKSLNSSKTQTKIRHKSSRNKLNISLCRKGEISFDTVAKTGNNVEAAFDFRLAVRVRVRIVRLVAFDNVALTPLLTWTGLYISNSKMSFTYDNEIQSYTIFSHRGAEEERTHVQRQHEYSLVHNII